MDELEDLQDLVRFAGLGAERPTAAQRQRVRRPPRAQDIVPQPLPPPEAGPVIEGADLEDLQQLVAIGRVRPELKHEARSWQATERARAAKALKKVSAEAKEEHRKRQLAEGILQHVVEEFPLVARVCNLRTKRGPMSEGRAAFMEQLAFMPTVRGDDRARGAQSRAAALVAACGADLQRDCVERLWCTNREQDLFEGVSPDENVVFRVHILSWQWDETTQKLPADIVAKALRGERCSQAAVSKQIMMQHGFVTKFLCTDRQNHVTTEPIFCRGLVLESQIAKTMLEGISRCSPVQFHEATSVAKVATPCDAFVASFCCDRASVNTAVLKSVWASLTKPEMPRNVLPFVEFCAAHGVALVKGRPQAAKTLISASHTLSACFRQWRFAHAFRDALLAVVRRELVVKKQQRPALAKERSQAIVEMLYGGEGAGYLFKVGRDGRRVPTSFYEDILALIEVVDLGAPAGERWIHWCFVEDGSALHSQGCPVGSPCCSSPEESVEKMAVPMLNFLLHRQWSQAAASRWTYVGTTLRKIAIGFLSHNVLPQCLSDLQALWDVKASVATLLERLVAADQDDFASKSKLRLLRCCQAFVPAAASWQIAVQITVLSAADTLLYKILGDGKTARANLATFMDEQSSPIAHLQQHLLLLMQDWSLGCSKWQLFQALGGDFEDDFVRRWARQTLLHTAAATFDHFEQRMSHAPYTLFKLGDSRVSVEAQTEIAKAFLATDDHCQSSFCRGLKVLCPTVWSLLETGPSIMQALSAGASIAIDATERSHGQMRLDIRSTGTTSNYTAAANRVFCHELRAEHLRRSGTDPAKPPISAAGGGSRARSDGDAECSAPQRRRLGGNARLEWQNSRLAAYKARVAPAQPLTNDQMESFRQKCSSDWALQVTSVEKEAWGQVSRGAQILRQSSVVVAVDSKQPEFQKVWAATHATAACPVPPSAIVAKYLALPDGERRAIAAKCPELVVEMSCRDLALESGDDRPFSLIGCQAQKKNVCRQTLAVDLRNNMEAICTMFCRYVDSIGPTVAKVPEQLVLLEPEQPDSQGRRLQVIALLADVRFSPKVQIFARCFLKEGNHPLQFNVPAGPGMIVSIAVRECRLARRFQVLHLCTSDDLALELAKLAPVWRLVPLEWELVAGSRNLLDMQIRCRGEAFVPKAKVVVRSSKVTSQAQATMDILDAGNPFEIGRLLSERAAASRPGLRKRPRRHLGAPCRLELQNRVDNRRRLSATHSNQPQNVSNTIVFVIRFFVGLIWPISNTALGQAFFQGLLSQCSLRGVTMLLHLHPTTGFEAPSILEEEDDGVACILDDVDLEGLPPDLVRDIISEHLFERVFLGQEQAAEDLGDTNPVDPEASSGDEAEIAAAFSEPALISVAEVCAAAQTSPGGYISSPVGVWAGRPMVGRLTTWPEHKPIPNRSVSVRCYLHTGCCTPARARGKVSDDRLREWLFSGVIPEVGASAARKRELAAAHRKLFAEIVEAMPTDRDTALPQAGGGSSTATSSTHPA